MDAPADTVDMKGQLCQFLLGQVLGTPSTVEVAETAVGAPADAEPAIVTEAAPETPLQQAVVVMDVEPDSDNSRDRSGDSADKGRLLGSCNWSTTDSVSIRMVPPL